MVERVAVGGGAVQFGQQVRHGVLREDALVDVCAAMIRGFGLRHGVVLLLLCAGGQAVAEPPAPAPRSGPAGEQPAAAKPAAGKPPAPQSPNPSAAKSAPAAEATIAAPEVGMTRAELMRRFDLNSDGKVDASESAIAQSRMRQKRIAAQSNQGFDPLTGLPRGESSGSPLGVDPLAEIRTRSQQGLPQDARASLAGPGEDVGLVLPDLGDEAATPQPQTILPDEPADPEPAATPSAAAGTPPAPRSGVGSLPSGPRQPAGRGSGATAADPNGARKSGPATGGVRAGAPPARSGYGAGAPSQDLNAARRFSDQPPQPPAGPGRGPLSSAAVRGGSGVGDGRSLGNGRLNGTAAGRSGGRPPQTRPPTFPTPSPTADRSMPAADFDTR